MKFSEPSARSDGPPAPRFRSLDLIALSEGQSIPSARLTALVGADPGLRGSRRSWRQRIAEASRGGRHTVLLIPAEDHHLTEIAVALSGNSPVPGQIALLREGGRLARLSGLPLVALNIWHLPERHLLRSARVRATEAGLERQLERQRRDSRARTEGLIADAGAEAVPAEVRDLEGAPGRALERHLRTRVGTLTLLRHPPPALFAREGPARVLHSRIPGALGLFPPQAGPSAAAQI